MTPQPQPDYTFAPPGFKPAPEGWYYPLDGVRQRGDVHICLSGESWPVEGTVGKPIVSPEGSRVIRRIPAEPVAKTLSDGGAVYVERVLTEAHAYYDQPEPVATPDYPAGLPPGLVRLASGALMVGDFGIGNTTGQVYRIDAFHLRSNPTVESWCRHGGKSAVYRKPEAKPPTIDSITDEIDKIAGGYDESKVPSRGEPDHIASAGKMVFTAEAGPLCVACGEARMHVWRADYNGTKGSPQWRCSDETCEAIAGLYDSKDDALADAPRLHARALAANELPAQFELAQKVIAAREEMLIIVCGERDKATAENTRLAGELEREKTARKADPEEWQKMLKNVVDNREIHLARVKDLEAAVQMRESDVIATKKERDEARAELARLKEDLKQSKIGESWAEDRFEKAKATLRELEARVKELETPIRIKNESDVYYIIPDGRGGFFYATPNQIAAAKGVKDVSK